VLTIVILIVIVSVRLAHQHSRKVAAEKPVLRRLMLPLAGALFVLVSGFGIALLWQYNHHLNELISSDIADIPNDFSLTLKLETDNISVALQPIVNDSKTCAALKSRDRECLLSLYSTRFDTMRKTYGITHFYFHGPDMVNILRLHKPDTYGDVIGRFTAREALSTGQTVSGIELERLWVH